MSFLGDITNAIGITSGYQADPYKVNTADITSPYQGQYAQMLQGALKVAPGQTQAIQGQTYQAPQLGMAGQATAYQGPSQLNLNQADQTRMQQMGLIGQLQNVANGGQSVAQAQLMAAQNQNAAALQSAAASQRGDVNPALAQRSLLNAYADQQQQTGQQYAALRAQEMVTAQSNLGNALSGLYGQDTNVAQQNAALQQANAAILNQNAQYNVGNQNQFAMQQAQMAQQAGQYNAGALQQAAATNQNAMQNQQSINNAQNLALLSQYGGLNSQTQNALLGAQQINAGGVAGSQTINAGVAQHQAEGVGNFLNSLGGAATGAL